MFSKSIICLATLAMLPSLARAADGSDAATLRTVSTTGEATVYVTPDEVVVYFGVETFDKALDEARRINDEASAKLVKAVRGFGVEEKHLQTASVQVTIRYHDYNDPNTGVEGYVARRAYSVTLKDVKRLEALVESALKNGANRLSGIAYLSTEIRKHRDEARRLAIRAAKEKAAALAAELDCTLGTARTITEGSRDYDDDFFSPNTTLSQNSVQQLDGEGGETMPLGQLAIHATISTTFDLVPASAAAGGVGAPETVPGKN